MISIIDYGMGNIGSISNMLKKIGVKSEVINSPEQLKKATKVILPGVGSFDNAIKTLHDLDFFEPIKETASKGVPILGICLGMQLLGTRSEEGKLPGLNLIPGKIIKFPELPDLRIPHMGWNVVVGKNAKLFDGLEHNKFYFVHSYYFKPDRNEFIAGTTQYGLEFTSSVNHDNVYGAQFHPEKSHKFGMQLLRNFSNI